jgi:hypothetical protein
MTPHRLKICAVTHDFPTDAQPYRGAPIWQTLIALERYAEVSIVCPVPVCPGIRRVLGSASGIYNQYPSHAGSQTSRIVPLTYFAIPRLTHARNGLTLTRTLRQSIAMQQPDIVLSYWIYPD